MNKTHTSTNNANKLAIKMATALIIGLIAGTSFIFLREKLISSGNSDTWTMINNLLFQDITKPEANNAIGIFYIVGQLFINSLQLVIVPMVFTSITLAMCNISDTKKLGRISYKTILGFLGTSVFALILAGIFGMTANKLGLFNVSINNIASSEGSVASNPLLVFVQKQKYTLRTWQTEDAHSLVQELNNKKIWDNCRNVFPHPYRLEHAETFIDLIQKKEGIHDFCIEVNGKAVGNIGFTPGTDVECFNAEVGYVIGEKYWNQGIVTDALQEAIYHYFTYTNTIRIFALVFEHNLPSMRVLEKAGFNKVGIMTKSIFKNGHFTNAHLFELLKNV